jgi:hypothetical protein
MQLEPRVMLFYKKLMGGMEGGLGEGGGTTYKKFPQSSPK